MKLTTILVAASAVLSGVVLASPVEAESAAAVRSILEARKCAYSGCSACREYCYRDMPCAPNHDCSIQTAGCILLCKSTGCCSN